MNFSFYILWRIYRNFLIVLQIRTRIELSFANVNNVECAITISFVVLVNIENEK